MPQMHWPTIYINPLPIVTLHLSWANSYTYGYWFKHKLKTLLFCMQLTVLLS